MAKVIAGNDGARELDIGNLRVYRRNGGFDVPAAHAKEIAQAIGGSVAGVGFASSRAASFWCEPCQFRSLLRRCGRCGAECTEENR